MPGRTDAERQGAGRLDTYRRVLRLQQKAFALKDPRLSRVEIPYQGTTLPAYFSQAPAADHGPAPVVAWSALCHVRLIQGPRAD